MAGELAMMLVSCNMAPRDCHRWLLRTVALAPTKIVISKGSIMLRRAHGERFL